MVEETTEQASDTSGIQLRPSSFTYHLIVDGQPLVIEDPIQAIILFKVNQIHETQQKILELIQKGDKK